MTGPGRLPALLAVLCVLPAAWIAAAASETPEFALPVRCALGQECYIQSYVDLDPTKGAADHACGTNTYDGHIGTDFRLRDLDLMDRGVPVLAAADGVVVRLREGVRDAHLKVFGRKLAWHHGAGNFIHINHGDGWRTRYLHLRRGSLRVKPGDRVRKGQEIGLVGMSGLVEFPHVHFEIYFEGKPVDPFVGRPSVPGCETEKQPVWAPDAARQLAYRRSFVMTSGFSDVALNREALLYGLHVSSRLSQKARNIVFHVDFAGAHAGDRYSLRIVGPDGGEFVRATDTIDKDAAVALRYAGRKLADKPGWPTGIYRGEFELFREEDGQKEVFIRHAETLWVE